MDTGMVQHPTAVGQEVQPSLRAATTGSCKRTEMQLQHHPLLSLQRRYDDPLEITRAREQSELRRRRALQQLQLN
jgi:hypothetical protein